MVENTCPEIIGPGPGKLIITVPVPVPVRPEIMSRSITENYCTSLLEQTFLFYLVLRKTVGYLSTVLGFIHPA